MRRASASPRTYAVIVVGSSSKHIITLGVDLLLETLGMNENEVLIAEKGQSPDDAIKVETKDMPRKYKNKPSPIRPGDEYMFRGKRYVVKSVAKNGKTVLHVKGPRVNRRDVYKNRVAYVAPPGYVPP